MSLNHIAIIMDGNGRWAKERGLKRVEGHKRGAEVVRTITTHLAKVGVKYLTLYAFSTENWKRPKFEVDFLMNLLDRYLKNELSTYLDNNIKFETIGDISKLPKKVQERIEKTKEATKNFTGLTQILALNYGGQDEILRASKKLCEKGLEFNKENFERELDTAKFAPVDLMIRTSGEKRISNFLLWQLAYSEFYFSDTLFPDFTIHELDDILEEFNARDRRFGGV